MLHYFFPNEWSELTVKNENETNFPKSSMSEAETKECVTMLQEICQDIFFFDQTM